MASSNLDRTNAITRPGKSPPKAFATGSRIDSAQATCFSEPVRAGRAISPASSAAAALPAAREASLLAW